jgi:uncharacterized protein (DUF433 family)
MTVKIPEPLQGILDSSPEVLSGAVRFKGTRIHLQILWDALLEGMGIDEFLEDYPDVSREQALAVLSWLQDLSQESFPIEQAS